MNHKGFINSLIIFLLAGCSFNSIFEQTVDIPKGTWNKNNPVTFLVPATDTISGFNLVFSLRNNNNYPYLNIFLFVDTYSPDSIKHRDTIQIKLAEDNGKWIGSGIGGLWQNEAYFKKNIRFPRSGQYRIVTYQAMRNDNLEGITDVGLRVEKFKTK